MAQKLIEMKRVEETLPIEVPKEFKGYSIEELRYQRALVALRKDFCLGKMAENVEKIRSRGLFGGSGEKQRGPQLGGIAKKLISGLGYLDYAMIGMSVFGTGKKIFNLIRGKKRK